MAETIPSPSQVPLFKRGEVIRSLSGEDRTVPLSELDKSKLLPTTRAEVDLMKSNLIRAKRDPEFKNVITKNGQIDPVTLVQFPDGSLHIANGYHRYQAILELAKELPAEFEPHIYAKITPGDSRFLWKLRLQGLGNHTRVVPARFVSFLLDSFDEKGVPLDMQTVVRATALEICDVERMMPRKGFTRETWLHLVEEVKGLIDYLQLTPVQVGEYLQLARGFPVEQIEQIVVNPRGPQDADRIAYVTALDIAEARMELPQKEVLIKASITHRLSRDQVGVLIDLIEHGHPHKSYVEEELLQELAPKRERESRQTGMKVPAELVNRLAMLETRVAVSESIRNAQAVALHTIALLMLEEDFQTQSAEVKENVLQTLISFAQDFRSLKRNPNLNGLLTELHIEQFSKKATLIILHRLKTVKQDQLSELVLHDLSRISFSNGHATVTTDTFSKRVVAQVVERLRELLKQYFIPVDEHQRLMEGKRQRET